VRFVPVGPRRLIRAAWEEYQVTRQCRGRATDLIATWRVPGWFKRVELGLGDAPSTAPVAGEEPPAPHRSLLYTFAWLERINARNLGFLRAQARLPKAPKRVTGKAAMRRLRAAKAPRRAASCEE
jgi:hypothetical protein